jgi:two-component system, cell cycle sensor histidine kinase and response regulator CckA
MRPGLIDKRDTYSSPSLCTPRAGGLTPSQEASLSSKQKTILLADDESAITVLLDMFLTELGYRVLIAHNGTEAAQLGVNLQESIDVLVTDWRMPGMAGDVLIRELRSVRPALKAILMSGYDQAKSAVDLDSSAVTFLQKPISPGELEQTIRMLLGVAAPVSGK